MSTSTESQTQASVCSYDEVQYPSYAYEATHPDQIYTLSKLFKLDPKLPDESSVLEIGCAGGGNLIPMAVQLPKARFVGVDLSVKQIEQAQKSIAALGLKNIEVRAADLRTIDSSIGKFDYIHCHGVFSWVPVEAQHKILDLCRELLNPDGVAFISYNAYPGWFMRGMIREMMLYHTKNFKDPTQKVQQARGLLNFIVTSTEGQNTPYAQILKQEMELLGKHPDSYFFHEHLEDNNRPMFFYQFMDMARSHGLQFLGDSNLASMITSNLAPKAAEALTNLTNDIYQRSQYTDFVTNRMFRQTLLCHADRTVKRHIDVNSVDGSYFCGRFTFPEGTNSLDLNPNVEIAIKCGNGRGLKTPHPVMKAMINTLNEAWPGSLSIPEMTRRIQERLASMLVVGEPINYPVETICKTQLLQMMVRGDVEMRYLPDRFASQIADRPMVSPYARYQATTEKLITSLRHSTVQLDALTQLLLPMIDGTRTKEELGKALGKMVEDGKLSINVQGEGAVDMSRLQSVAISKVLEQLRRAALLVG